ncbi:MAG: hypothetical protein JJE35_10055 [Thermoleophilia bacterium]|nr:hypothetical protein [Thermoleophilia bacterium]
MRKTKQVVAVAVALAATLAIGIPVAASNEAGETKVIKTTISVNPYGNAGKVRASNPNCVEGRRVVIKQKGHGKIGAATTNDKGAWQAEPAYKGSPPLKVYAEVKPVTQGTAGTIYQCKAATSRTLTINGG